MTVLLAQHPGAWAKLSAEVASNGGVPRSPADLKRFPFAEAVFREALRLYPPVPRDLRVAEVSELDLQLEGGKVRAYRAKVKVSFKYES